MTARVPFDENNPQHLLLLKLFALRCEMAQNDGHGEPVRSPIVGEPLGDRQGEASWIAYNVAPVAYVEVNLTLPLHALEHVDSLLGYAEPDEEITKILQAYRDVAPKAGDVA